MFAAYVLESLKTGKYYIGSTADLKKRIVAHNEGRSRFTKSGIPWRLVYHEAFKSRSEAMMREKRIKSYKGGEAFKKLIHR